MYDVTAKKLVPVDVKLEIKEITLLTAEEANLIPNEYLADVNTWLRTPRNKRLVAVTTPRHAEHPKTFYSMRVHCRVMDDHPALKIVQDESLQIGEQVELFGYTWTKVLPDTLISDTSIGEHCYREDIDAPDANVWEASDLKVWLEQWLEEKCG